MKKKNKEKINPSSFDIAGTVLLLNINRYEILLSYSPTINNSIETVKRLREKIDLMTYREDFEVEVRYFRQRFLIPISGFETFKECKTWVVDLCQKSDPNNYWKNQKEKAAAKLEEGPGAFLDSLPITEYEEAVKYILRTFDINIRWKDAIEYYLLFNKTDNSNLFPRSVEFMIRRLSENEPLGLFIQIWPDTQQQDLLHWWDIIATWQALLKVQIDSKLDMKKGKELAKAMEKITDLELYDKRQKAQKNFSHRVLDKYKRAYDLRTKEKKTYAQIGKILNCSYGNVGILLRRFQDIVEKNKLD